MNEGAERLLQSLDPPPHGWERLVERRSMNARNARPAWIAFASGAAAAALALLALDVRHVAPLPLPTAGARLEGKAVDGDPLRLIGAGHLTALPASPGVRLYWTDGGTK
jgi:hypothetical protein